MDYTEKKRKNLYLLCGPSGAGKTSWVGVQFEKAIKKKIHCWHCSRDMIRFALLKDDEDYFAHEDEVFEKFCKEIQYGIDSPSYNYIFVDATHLNERSRNKVLDRLENLNTVNIIPVDFQISLETCIAQNEKRKDNPRAYVPKDPLLRMYYAYRAPTNKEKHKYFKIIHIREE